MDCQLKRIETINCGLIHITILIDEVIENVYIVIKDREMESIPSSIPYFINVKALVLKLIQKIHYVLNFPFFGKFQKNINLLEILLFFLSVFYKLTILMNCNQ